MLNFTGGTFLLKRQKLISIGQLSKITEVSIKSLRYYDKIGILPPKYVDPDTSYRYYTFQQARLVEIIQFCIELGIPLKRFPEFLEKDSQRIQFSQLLEEGTTLATEKIKRIEEQVLMFQEMQKDIKRSESFENGEIFQRVSLKKHDYWLQAYDGPQEGNLYHEATNRMFEQVLSLSLEAGYEFGKLLLFQENMWKQFLFIDVTVGKEERKKYSNILHFAAGDYLCTTAKSDDFSASPSVFSGELSGVEKRAIFEIEMFSGVYDTENPVFEWYCSEQL